MLVIKEYETLFTRREREGFKKYEYTPEELKNLVRIIEHENDILENEVGGREQDISLKTIENNEIVFKYEKKFESGRIMRGKFTVERSELS